MSKNTRYWIIGNIAALNAGFLLIIFIFLNCIYRYLELPVFHKDYIIALLLPPFFTAMILKFIKEDCPVFFYCSTGWLFGLFFILFSKLFPFFRICRYDHNISQKYLAVCFLTELKNFFEIFPGNYILLFVSIIFIISLVSMAGGLLTDIIRIFLRSSFILALGVMLAVFLITVGFTFMFYYAPVSSPGFESSDAQQAYNTTMDSFLLDFRSLGSGVSMESCGVNKEDSIKEATECKGIKFYGELNNNKSDIELVEYVISQDGYLIRTVYEQSGTGKDSSWDKILTEDVLVGSKCPEIYVSKVRLAAEPAGFKLIYFDENKQRFYSDDGKLTSEQKKQVRYIAISICVKDNNRDATYPPVPERVQPFIAGLKF